MSQGYGIEAPHAHAGGPAQRPVRYVVLIDSASAGSRLARLFLEDRVAVAELDAGAPEVQRMVEGLIPDRGAAQAEWSAALAGHSAQERAAAEVFKLDV